MRARLPLSAVLTALALGVSACGGGHDDGAKVDNKRTGTTPSGSTTPRADGGGQADAVLPASTKGPAADAGAARTIRGWVDAARTGDSARAATYFDLPALVQNGDQPLLLHTRGDVRAFTEALPCGARFVKAVKAPRGYVIGTFLLVDRPGGNCGTGTGNYAATAFRFSHGRIKQWLRVDEKSLPTESVTPPSAKGAPTPAPGGPTPTTGAGPIV
jgi:hypothetical protein